MLPQMSESPIENARLTQLNIKTISDRVSEHIAQRIRNAQEGKKYSKVKESLLVARKKHNQVVLVLTYELEPGNYETEEVEEFSAFLCIISLDYIDPDVTTTQTVKIH